MRLGTVLAWMWGVFGVYWVGAALGAKRKSVSGEWGGLRVLRWSILAVTFILLLTSWLRPGPLGWRFVPQHALFRWLGVAMTIGGLLLCVWARLSLGTYWSDKVVLKVNHQLIQKGPYGRMRHPIYSGVLLAIAGTALAIGEWRGVVALLLLGTNYLVKARREERILAAHFGEAFAKYKCRAGFLAPKW